MVYVPHNIESCGKLPALVYQTGYGCTYLAEELVLEKIAAAGFIVVAPQRENETNAPQNRTDGKDLLSALDFLQEEDAKGSGALIEGQKVIWLALEFRILKTAGTLLYLIVFASLWELLIGRNSWSLFYGEQAKWLT